MSISPILQIPSRFIPAINRQGSVANVRAEIQISKATATDWQPIKMIKFRNYTLNAESDSLQLESGESYLAELWLVCEETPLGGAYDFSITYNNQQVTAMQGDVDTTPGKLDVITSDKPYITLLLVQ